MTVAIYGYKPAVHPANYAEIATADSINQRAYISQPMIQHGWAIKGYARAGRVVSGIPEARIGFWDIIDSTHIGGLAGMTSSFNMGTYMLNETDGTTYGGNLNATHQMWSGVRYAPGMVATDYTYGYGHNDLASGGMDAVYNIEYRRSVATNPTLQDPFDASSSASRGHMAVWIEYDINVAPDKPLNATALPVDNAVVTEFPVLSNEFSDDNETLSNGLTGDSMKSARVIVRHKSSNALMWDYKYDVTPAERVAGVFSIAYNGSALTIGEEYKWTCIVYHQFDTGSADMDYIDFTVAGGYFDTSTTALTGKVETVQPSPFTGIWNDPLDDVDDVQVSIWNAAGDTMVQQGDWWNVASGLGDPGDTVSVSWADSGLAVDLVPGTTYTYKMRGRDIADVATAWSTPTTTFYINHPPAIPTFSNPLPPESTQSSRPLIVLEMGDADDNSGSGLTASVRIKDSDGNVLFTRATTYDAPTDTWRYQTTSTDLPSADDYKFDAWGYDGSFYSSGSTSLGAGSLSDEVLFHYTDGPTVTLNEPDDSDVVNTNTPVIDWTMTDPERYRVRIWDATSQTYENLIYDSGEITDTDTDHTVPAGYMEDGAEYWVQVTGWDSLNDEGTSSTNYFTVDFDEATEIAAFEYGAHHARGDKDPTSITLSWDRTNYTSEQFVEYILTRRAASDERFDVDDELRDANRRIAVLRSPSETTWTDYLPASGIAYTYGISQVVVVDGVTIRSPIVRLDAQIDFKETVICDARHAGARRVVLRYRGDRNIERFTDQVERIAWGQSKPDFYRGARLNRVIDGEFQVIGEDEVDIEQVMLELDKLMYYGGPLCYRDGRGRRYFGELTKFQEIDSPAGKERAVSITFVQTSATEEENR